MDKPPDLKRRKIHRSSDVLDYNSAFRFQAWKRERKWADLIMGHVRRNNLPLHLDKLTRGEGNCFMIAVMQQLQQNDVYRNCRRDVQNLADEFDHMRFRKSVKDFIKILRIQELVTSKVTTWLQKRQELKPKVGMSTGRQKWSLAHGLTLTSFLLVLTSLIKTW